MKKRAVIFGVMVVLSLVTILVPSLTLADEYSYTGKPAFTLTYPEGSFEAEKAGDQVFRVQYPGGFFIDATVSPITAGIDLKDFAEKSYKPALEKDQKTTVTVANNKEITLSGGTKAYYSELKWVHPPSGTPLVTMIVSAYKDGKVVTAGAHPYTDFATYEKIVKSLTFK